MRLDQPLSTITPTLDGDVLAVLATADAGFTAGQLHRILPRRSPEGLRKTLRRLAGQGIVQADRVGTADVYRFNRDHLAAEHIIGLVDLPKTFLRRLENRLESWTIPPVYAAVFGSAARGSMSKDSDIDLLLIRPDDAVDDTWDQQISDLVAEVTRWLGNDTRPLEFTEAEVATRGRKEPVLADVLRDGLTVAGNRAWLASKLRNSDG